MFAKSGERPGFDAASDRTTPGLSLLHTDLYSSPEVSGFGFRFPSVAMAVGRYAHPSCQQNCQSGCYASRRWPLAGLRFLFCSYPSITG